MTTATTSTVIDHTSDAGFRAWVAEIILQLVTTCGITQTADTGQINTSTVTRPAVNTAAGYSILRFNDTLQATAPVFIKLEYGTGSSAADPNMWITVGTGSNGSGTITGTTTVRAAVVSASAPVSSSTSYTSRYVYNATSGYLGLVWKTAGAGTATSSLGGFVVFRSNDTSGATTADSINLITNSGAAGSVSTSCGYEQCYSYSASLVYPPSPNGTSWLGTSSSTGMPFGLTSTVVGGNSYVVPVLYLTPILTISAFNCAALLAEAPLGTTFSATLVGATAHTFLSVGQPFGNANLGITSTTTVGFCMLWE